MHYCEFHLWFANKFLNVKNVLLRITGENQHTSIKIISTIFHILVNHTPRSSDLAGVNFEVNLKHERLSS